MVGDYSINKGKIYRYDLNAKLLSTFYRKQFVLGLVYYVYSIQEVFYSHYMTDFKAKHIFSY